MPPPPAADGNTPPRPDAAGVVMHMDSEGQRLAGRWYRRQVLLRTPPMAASWSLMR